MKKTNSIPTATALVTPTGSGTNDIRGIKPPVLIADGWMTLLVTAGILALIALAVWLSIRRHRRPVQMPSPVLVPPHIRAKQRLEQALGLLSDPRLFCIAVSDTTRLYLEERFSLQAPDRTTEEFLQELQHSEHLLPDQKMTLVQFLERCDLVKFARLEPTESELRILYAVAERLIDETSPVANAAQTTSTPPTPAP